MWPIAIAAVTALGFGGWLGASTNAAIENPPASLPSGNSNSAGINLTTIAGYAIAGGLVYYFGKKIIK